MAALDPFHHVQDADRFEILSENLVPGGLYVPLPSVPIPFFNLVDGRIDIYNFQITKFMVLEVIAAALICLIYIPLSRRIVSGDPPHGFFWNTFESILTFLRENVARPNLTDPHPHHDHGEEHGEGHGDEHHRYDPAVLVDRYTPYLWTVFLFILFCNLLGMVPYMGSPTGNIWVTGALALCSFVLMHGGATARMGLIGYLGSLWPAMDIPFAIAIFVKPMIFLIELFGTVIKSVVLAVRLFANLLAGHLVLSVILLFIVMANHTMVGAIGWGGITAVSIAGVVALSLLELFVAFLQAFIFTFLTALFLGMAVYPQH